MQSGSPRLQASGIRLQVFFVTGGARITPWWVKQSDRCRQNTCATSHTASAARAIQIASTTTAATLMTGLSFAPLGEDRRWDHSYRERDPERDDDQIVEVPEDGDRVG